MNIQKYKEWKIYYYDDILEKLGERIIDNNYKVIKILKDGKRNYVAKIKIDSKEYILKEIRSEVIIPQRKIQTFFKEGEAITTLKNGISSIEEGVDELVRPILAIVKKKKLIEKSFILMEYIVGKRLDSLEDIDGVIKIIKKVHKLGRYHGDLNTSNFIKTENGLKMLDTQMKKDKFLSFKRIYDILTLKEDLLVINLGYDVEKNYQFNKKSISYLLAYSIKKIKKSKGINKLRAYKKDLREKGWKI